MAGPDRLTLESFKVGGPVLSVELTEIFARVLELYIVPFDWSRPLIVPFPL